MVKAAAVERYAGYRHGGDRKSQSRRGDFESMQDVADEAEHGHR